MLEYVYQASGHSKGLKEEEEEGGKCNLSKEEGKNFFFASVGGLVRKQQKKHRISDMQFSSEHASVKGTNCYRLTPNIYTCVYVRMTCYNFV